MPWIELIVIVAVLIGVALMAGGRGAGLSAVPEDRPDRLVDTETGALTSADIRDVRFGVGFRGYRMDEVDALLDRLAAQLPESSSDWAEDSVTETSADSTTHLDEEPPGESGTEPSTEPASDWTDRSATQPHRHRSS